MAVRCELIDDRIRLTGWLGEQTPAMCKAVGAGRFVGRDKGGPYWHYPLDTATCYRLREMFGQKLQIGPDLNIWARSAMAEEKATRELAKAADAELLHIATRAPRIAEAMSGRTYQRVAALYGARTGDFLLADQQGLGKTIETLATIAETSPSGLHLILAPKVAVGSVWVPEIERWLPGSAVFAMSGSKAEREEILAAAMTARHESPLLKHIFVIGNIEMTRIKNKAAEYPQLHSGEWDTVIVDESHRALIRTKGTPTQTRAGMMALKAKRRIALSGTPMRGKPQQLWGTLNWLRPDLYTSYWVWVGRYFQLSSNGYSNYVLGDLKPGGADALARDLGSIMLRRTKAEVLTELPAKSYAGTFLLPIDDQSPYGVWLEMDTKHARQYETFAKDGSIDFEDGGSLLANGVLAEYTRKKQLASGVHELIAGRLTPTLDSPKYRWLLDKIAELGITDNDGDGKIVIASQFTSILNVFARGLRAEGIACHLLTGATSDKARQEMVADFQTEGSTTRVFLLNMKAGGVGITLDLADDLVMLDETTVPDDAEQVEDRIHRASRIHNVTIHYLRVRETQDEEIAWVAAARLNTQQYLMDGSRGVAYARELYEASRGANVA